MTDWTDPAVIGLAIMVFGQFGAIIWFAAAMKTRMDAVEKDAANTAALLERLVRVETTVQGVVETARRIESKIDRMETGH